MVGKRDKADQDPLFKWVPLMPDVLQWHHDEITELPLGAVLLAASTRYPHQAFRLGDRAWGLQFHIECDTAMIADWAKDSATLAELGYDPDVVVDGLRPPDGRRRGGVAALRRPVRRARARRARRRRAVPQPAAAGPLSMSRPSSPRGPARAVRLRLTMATGPRELLGPDGLGLWDPAAQEPAGEAAAELIGGLSRAADPDLALRQLHRLVEFARRRPRRPADKEVLAALDEDPGLQRRLVAVLGASSALGDHLVANPGTGGRCPRVPTARRRRRRARWSRWTARTRSRRCASRTGWRCCASPPPT